MLRGWLVRVAVVGGLMVFAGAQGFAAYGQAAGAQVAAKQDVGATVYVENCAACHELDGSGGIKGPAIARLPKTIARSDAELTRIVKNGVPGKGMPPMKELGDERIEAVVMYVRRLQAENMGKVGRSAIGSGGGSETWAGRDTDADTAAAEAAMRAPGELLAMKDAPGVTLEKLRGFEVNARELAQKQVEENWVSYNGDYSGRRFSAMTEITPANAGTMVAKWRFTTSGAGVMEVTPVVVAGVMFVTRSNDAWALDAKTGRMLWHHARPVSSGLIDDAARHLNRGVAVLGTRVFMETDNAHLVCLDARTGEQLWDVAYATGNRNYGATSAPLVVKGRVIVGTSGGDEGVRGFVAAYDAVTGKEDWRFWTIPAPGEKGNESWPGEMYKHGGGTTWMPGTFDAELNTIYWGTGNPSPDFDGSVRPGDDLYTSCLLALDPDTGRLKWYFQYSPHNLYDYDAVQTPVLVDAVFKGKQRKLVVTANRNGFLYVLDRVTGEYLYSKQFLRKQNWAKRIDARGRPVSANRVPDEKGVRVCPSVDGGTNWYAPSYDPATGMFYFRSLEACSVFKARQEKYEEGKGYFSTGASRGYNDPVSKGYINAFDVSRRKFAWRDELGGGRHAVSGVVSTAGGVVAFGNDAQEFEVDDARTGARLWGFKVVDLMKASPMAFGVGGREYFAVAAGDDVIAFGLP
ncbi:MAG: PQQ-binding-like beta-propeller repeat protein [Acidobacteriaceae bacterium]